MVKGRTRASIFAKARLRPSQLRTVAGRRLDDAEYLERSGKNRHANGAMYLGGFVLECLLKAKLLEKYRWLRSAGSADGKPKPDRHIWNLCYRWHDLEALLAVLPEIRERLQNSGPRGRSRLLEQLNEVCSLWSVFARYSPQTATMKDAKGFLDIVRELKPWLN
jgi:hypothetical protein